MRQGDTTQFYEGGKQGISDLDWGSRVNRSEQRRTLRRFQVYQDVPGFA